MRRVRNRHGAQGQLFATWRDDIRVTNLAAATSLDRPSPTQRALGALVRRQRADDTALRSFEWADRHENLVACGPPGLGKGHFLEALGYTAIDPAGFDELIPKSIANADDR